MAVIQNLKTISLVVACATIINFGYLVTNFYDIPSVITVILIPCVLVICLAWFLKSIKKTMAMSFMAILIAALFNYISLTTPVWLGVIDDVYYGNLFNYTVFLKVMQLLFVTMFFSILTALVAGLAFE
jgi:hypothetical protein